VITGPCLPTRNRSAHELRSSRGSDHIRSDRNHVHETKRSFTKLVPSLLTALAYVVAFYCLSLTLKTIPTGVAYAIWSGCGIIVLIAAVAWIIQGQKLDVPAMAGMGLIVAGVIVMNAFSKTAAH
jgi:small multidrug resistance pump